MSHPICPVCGTSYTLIIVNFGGPPVKTCAKCEINRLRDIEKRAEDVEGIGKALYEACRLEDMPDWGTDNYLDADFMVQALAVQKHLRGG